MSIPVAEARKFPAPSSTDWPSTVPLRDIANEPPDFQGKYAIVSFLATHKDEAYPIDVLLKTILSPQHLKFNERTSTYDPRVRELVDVGKILACKKDGKIYVYYEGP